jgi:hypothetical protein
MAEKKHIKKTHIEKLTKKLNNLLSLPPINSDNYNSAYNYRYQVAARNSKIKQLQRELAQTEGKLEK